MKLLFLLLLPLSVLANGDYSCVIISAKDDTIKHTFQGNYVPTVGGNVIQIKELDKRPANGIVPIVRDKTIINSDELIITTNENFYTSCRKNIQ